MNIPSPSSTTTPFFSSTSANNFSNKNSNGNILSSSSSSPSFPSSSSTSSFSSTNSSREFDTPSPSQLQTQTTFSNIHTYNVTTSNAPNFQSQSYQSSQFSQQQNFSSIASTSVSNFSSQTHLHQQQQQQQQVMPTQFNSIEPNYPSTDSFDSNQTTSSGAPSTLTMNSNFFIQNKCRQLPCKTYISTGTCPYGDRCVFLHDPYITGKTIYIKTKRKSKESLTTDLFFWPTMPINLVSMKLDEKKLPHVFQSYRVPPPNNSTNLNNSNNDGAVYSMWENFLDFCARESLILGINNNRPIVQLNPLNVINPYNGQKRLNCFVQLSLGSSLSSGNTVANTSH